MNRKVTGVILAGTLLLGGCVRVISESPYSHVPSSWEMTGEAEIKETNTLAQSSTEETSPTALLTQAETGTHTYTSQTDGEAGQGDTEIQETAKKTEPADTDTTQLTEEPSSEHGDGWKEMALGRPLPETLRQINAATMENPASGVRDLFSMTFTPAGVKEMIEGYVFPDEPYISGRPVTEADRLRIEGNRNLEALAGQKAFAVTYGILIKNASVRSFPTEERITKAGGDSAADFDYFQESLLLVGEPVALLHQSLDGLYTFVQGRNYSGWMLTDCIQVCDRDLAQAVVSCSDFVVITDSFCQVSGTDHGSLLRMGTALPLLEETDESCLTAIFCAKEEAEGCFAFLEGELRYFKAAYAPQDASVLWVCERVISKSSAHVGYVAFLETNLLRLAENMLGSSYSWGDEGIGYDCSSTVGGIYRCFGIILPRNSGILKYTGAQVTDLTAMTADEKRSFITSLPAGTILVLPGHVMMYMGQQRVALSGQSLECPAMLHCVTGYVDIDGAAVEVYSCVLTSIDIRTRGAESYLDLMNVCVSFRLD